MNQHFGLANTLSLVNEPGDKNDGSAEDASPWAFKKLSLTHMTGLADQIDVRADIPRKDGLFGIDNLQITTKERCSPRYNIARTFLKNILD